MNLRLPAYAAGVLAVSGIVISAGIVLMGPATGPAPSPALLSERLGGVDLPATVSIHGPGKISPLQPDADAAATGLIAVRDQRTGLLGLRSPDGRVVGYDQPVFVQSGMSAGGALQAFNDCSRPDHCKLLINDRNAPPGRGAQTINLRAFFVVEGEWAPADERFAARDGDGNLYLIGPNDTAPRPVMSGVTTFAWAAGGVLLFATESQSGANLWKTDARGVPSRLTAVDAAVDRMYGSTDLTRFAFAQSDPAGWRLLTVAVSDGALEDFGHLGASEAVVMPSAPAFSIAWSPDSKYLALGPVTDRFAVHIVEPGGEASMRIHRFSSGFAGELRWSPDSSALAISTYAPNCVWHEVYLIDVASVDAQPRFVLDGCEIVWSPTGEYIAVKREPSRATAVAVIRADSGGYWHVANQFGLTPVAWGTDEKTTLQLAQQPVRRSSQLGK